MNEPDVTAKWFSAVADAAKDTLAVIKGALPKNDPLRLALTVVVLILLVAAFVKMVDLLLGRVLLDVLFIVSCAALLGLLIALLFAALYPTTNPTRQRRAQGTLAVIIVVALLISWTVGFRSADMVQMARFDFEYIRLLLNGQTFDSFATNASSGGLKDDVDSLDRFITNKKHDQPPVPGIGLDGTLINQRELLEALVTRQHLNVSGRQSVARAWQRGTIVLAAKTIDLDNADLTIGSYNLVIIANELTVKSLAQIRAFDRRPENSAAPTNPTGDGVDGLQAGDVYLVVLGKITGTIGIDLRGEDGGPGAPGQDGEDVPTDQQPATLLSDGVGAIQAVSVDELKARRESFKGSTPAIRAEQDEFIRACGNQTRCIIGECTHIASAGAAGHDATSVPAEEARGKQGGTGGPGGHLYLYVRADHPDALTDGIQFNAEERASGGTGGRGGRSGRGGRGGQRQATGPADPYALCSKGSDGPSGRDGVPGGEGGKGGAGRKPLGPERQNIQLESLFGPIT
jgi:hypothetical protein